MLVSKKVIIVGVCITCLILLLYYKAVTEKSLFSGKRNAPTESVNTLYKTISEANHFSPVTSHQLTIDKGTQHPNTHGYLLALRIMEQQTTGAKNVLQLGCLAVSMGLRAVEPYAADSFFFYPLSIETMNLKQSFSDYYSSVSVKMNYQHATFDKWGTFMNTAPKKIIFVHLSYDKVPFASQATLLPVGNCHITSNLKDFISHNGFTLARCIDYVFTNETGPGVKLTDPTEFSRNIFGQYHPSQVNVVFGKWKGLGTRTRVPLDTSCRSILSRHLMPSHSLMADSDRYIQSYFQGNEYISIMLRTEKVILHSDGDNDEYFSKELAGCYRNVYDVIAKIRKHFNKQLGVFMTVDLGLFGTKGDPHFNTGKRTSTGSPVYQSTIEFMKEMYGDPHWSLAKWEQSFLNIAVRKNDTGYIAGLQRAVATKSLCLIVVGGGSFQQLSIDLFKNLHSAQEQACLYKACFT